MGSPVEPIYPMSARCVGSSVPDVDIQGRVLGGVETERASAARLVTHDVSDATRRLVISRFPILGRHSIERPKALISPGILSKRRRI